MDHVDECEKILETLPDFIKTANQNISQSIITDKEEIILPTNVLEQLHSSIPNASLLTRAWIKHNSKNLVRSNTVPVENQNSSAKNKAKGKSKTSDERVVDSNKMREEIDITLQELDFFKQNMAKDEKSSPQKAQSDDTMNKLTKTPSTTKDQKSDDFVFDDGENSKSGSDNEESKDSSVAFRNKYEPSPIILPKSQKILVQKKSKNPEEEEKLLAQILREPLERQLNKAKPRRSNSQHPPVINRRNIKKKVENSNYRNVLSNLADSLNLVAQPVVDPVAVNRKRKYHEISSVESGQEDKDSDYVYKEKRRNI